MSNKMRKPKINIEIACLILKELMGDISPEQLEKIERWKDAHPDNIALYEKLNSRIQWRVRQQILEDYDSEIEWKKLLNKIDVSGKALTQKKRQSYFKKIVFNYVSVAAMIIVFVGLLFYAKTNSNKSKYTNQLYSAVIEPGCEKAILTLADGRTIMLDRLEFEKKLKKVVD